MNIEDLKLDQQTKIDLFRKEYESVPEFVRLRTFVEENAFGFGEKQFYPLHKLLVDSLDSESINFLEVGVFRGQTLALYGILSELCDKVINIYGVSPLDSTDGHWESDYKKDIEDIHNKFMLPQPNIIEGLSQEQSVISQCGEMLYDIVYIDGGHTKEVVTSDIENYAPMVKKGGYLVIDDSANNIKGTINGFFWGIQEVSDVVDSLLPPKTENPDWEYIGNVVHNRVFIRV